MHFAFVDGKEICLSHCFCFLCVSRKTRYDSDSSTPKQPCQFRFLELPHLSIPNSTATKRSNLGDLGDNDILATKFCASVYRDTTRLGLVLCKFQPTLMWVSKALVFLTAGRNLILIASSLVMLSILSNADHILEIKLLAIIFQHLILCILVCSTLQSVSCEKKKNSCVGPRKK